MQGSSIIVARPTINIAGQDSLELTEGLLSLLIDENTSGLYRCEVTFGNWGAISNDINYLYFGRALLDFGTEIQVKYGGNTLFDGRIMGMEAHFPAREEPTITVLAEDRFQDLRMTRRTRTFLDVSDDDVLHQIISDYGLTPGISITGTQHKILAQLNQSDLAFMRERARVLDAELWIENGTVHVESRPNRGSQIALLTYLLDLRSFSVLADLAGQRTSVIASGWSPADKDVTQYEATSSAIASEVRNGVSGVSIVDSVLGLRKELLIHATPGSAEEAQHIAEAYFKMSARRFVVGHGVAETKSQLRVGNSVDLTGLGVLFDGRYYLSEVTYLFDSVNGIRTEFTAERPYIGSGR